MDGGAIASQLGKRKYEYHRQSSCSLREKNWSITGFVLHNLQSYSSQYVLNPRLFSSNISKPINLCHRERQDPSFPLGRVAQTALSPHTLRFHPPKLSASFQESISEVMVA